MTNQHPITVPIGSITFWKISYRATCQEDISETEYIATQAAQWGADQELEACCKWLGPLGIKGGDNLRRARRPKPPSLKEQAIKDLDDLEVNLKDFGMGFVPITNLRKALEALPND